MVRLLWFLAPLMVVLFGCTVSDAEVEQVELDIADAPIEITVTAVQMYEDYENNEIAANQKYDEKVLVVSGIIESFGGGEDSAYYVDLATGDFTLTNVRCYFSQSHLNDITSLQKGDRVALRGKGDEGEDRNPFTIDIAGCSIFKGQ